MTNTPKNGTGRVNLALSMHRILSFNEIECHDVISYCEVHIACNPHLLSIIFVSSESLPMYLYGGCGATCPKF